MFQFLTNRILKRKAPAVVEAIPKKRRYSTALYKPLVWIDCEMTGLDIAKDHIIEICCIITDGNLNIIDEKGYESTVYVPKKVLDNMNEWCVNQHGKSGLTAKVLANPQQTLAKVQQELLDYIQFYIPEPRTSLLAGNSVHMDKFFMMKEFPQVIDHLHYRLVDVSSIMEVGFRHNPALMKCFPRKKGNHTAKSDILESINQLKWYQDNYLRSDIPEGVSVPQREDAPVKRIKLDIAEDATTTEEKQEVSKQETKEEETTEVEKPTTDTIEEEASATGKETNTQ
ncbi:putative oligoribonuclease [Clavispora lusitaniae]|uniref:Oligoribonuclease n=1 Tax=Clavispora lusitaniae TaxID=36911 RepID=A0AA91Q2K2_CLALS|nr:putative oligoribonuclease [Clavispora lusitaniae]